jgi:hypothetical protein
MLSSADLAVYRAGQAHIRRYLSVAPRTSVYTATVNALTTDSETGGIHQLTLTGGTGTLSEVRAGLTIDIGTTAGGRDVGQARVRKNLTGAALDIGVIAPAECAAAVGQHVTIRRERRLWRVLPRVVATSVGAPYPDSFTLYADYDTPYTNQNDAVQPHANITAAVGGAPVRPAGFVDSGQPYRTVTLHAGTSVALGHGASITAYAWEVGDGTITVGSASSAGITVRFPVGFRYIALTVTDSSGVTHTRYFPIWAHDDDNMPLTAFRVVDDVRTAEAGRRMTIEAFGADGTWGAAALPAGTTLCYWELAQYRADGVSAPASQTDSLLGWALSDGETARIGDASRARVEIGGAAAWLSRFGATPQTLRDTGAASAAWDEMRRITADRAAHYALRVWSNALTLCNFYPAGVSDTAQRFTLDGGSVWRAAGAAAAAGRIGRISADSLNGIWLRREYSHLSEGERAGRSSVLALTAADWADADGLTLGTARAPQTGVVEGRGAAWDSSATDVTAPTAYASRAPGRTDGAGAASGRTAAQILPLVDAQATLNALTGHAYAAANNPRETLTIRLLHPIDALEPAWDEPVTVTWAGGGVMGMALDAAPCKVTRVEIAHDNGGTNDAAKMVTWTLIPSTRGLPGESVPIITTVNPPPLDPPPPVDPPGVLTGNTRRIALFATDNRLYRTTNFNAASPTWTSVNLSALANWGGGTLCDFTVDAYSPAYISGSGAVNGWIATTSHWQRITDIFGSPVLATAVALTDTTQARCMNFERGTQNWGIIPSYKEGVGVRAGRTTTGTGLAGQVLLGTASGSGGDIWTPGLAVSPHIAGKAYSSDFTSSGGSSGCYTYTHGAANWTLSGTNTGSPDRWRNGGISLTLGGATFTVDSIQTLGDGLGITTLRWTAYAGGSQIFDYVWYSGNFTSAWVDDVQNWSGAVSGADQVVVSANGNLDIHDVEVCVTVTGGGTVSPRAIATTDYGATWASTSAFALSGGLATSIVVPYQNTAFTTLFYGDGAASARRLKRSIGGVVTNISPTHGGNMYGVGLAPNQGNRAIASSDGNPNLLVLVGYSSVTGHYGVFLTRNAGAAAPTWTPILAPAASVLYRGVYVAGDGGETLFLFGANGAIGMSTPTAGGGVRVVSKRGNLSTTGAIVGLCGG